MLKFVFAVSVAGLAFTDTYSSAPHEFSAVELRDLLLLGAAAHALLLGAALAFLRFRAQNAVLASIVALSAASANLIHTDLYLIGHRAVFWGSVMAIWAGLFAVLEFMDSNRWLRGGSQCLRWRRWRSRRHPIWGYCPWMQIPPSRPGTTSIC